MKIHRPPVLVLATLATLGLAAFCWLPARGAAQLAHPVGNSPRASGPVVVMVVGFRNDRGQLLGGLYDRAAAWLLENQAVGDCHARILGGRARCSFDAVPAGSVAFAALHDEDGDGELDRDPIGIPSEGYAFSNDVREPLGPPSFDAAAFSSSRTAPFVVHVRYGI